jgi:hypothetical protein
MVIRHNPEMPPLTLLQRRLSRFRNPRLLHPLIRGAAASLRFDHGMKPRRRRAHEVGLRIQREGRTAAVTLIDTVDAGRIAMIPKPRVTRRAKPLHPLGRLTKLAGVMPVLERSAPAALEIIPAIGWVLRTQDRLSIGQRRRARRAWQDRRRLVWHRGKNRGHRCKPSTRACTTSAGS